MERKVPTHDEITSFIRRLSGINELDPEQQKDLVGKIIYKVVVAPDCSEYEIFLRIQKNAPPQSGSAPVVEAGRTQQYSTFAIRYSRSSAAHRLPL